MKQKLNKNCVDQNETAQKWMTKNNLKYRERHIELKKETLEGHQNVIFFSSTIRIRNQNA